jgi:NADPH oxidase
MKCWLYLHGLAIGLFILGYYLQSSNVCLSNLNRLQYSVYISRGAGLTLSVFMTLNLIINLKYTLTFLRQYNFFYWIKPLYPQYAIRIHKDISGIITIYAIIHSVAHYFNFYTAEIIGISTMYKIHYYTYGGITGHIMTVFMFSLLLFSVEFFRKNWYNTIFKRLHNLYYIVFVAFIFHSRGCFVKTNDMRCMPYFSLYHFSATFLIFIIEKSFIFFNKPLQLKDTFYYKDCLKLTFKKTINYRAGQYILIRVKGSLLPYEYHPFTITSHPDTDNYISIHIRQSGDWTRSLRDSIDENLDLQFYYDGPFSSPSELQDNNCIVVATGIGITPYISFIKEIIYKYKNKTIDIKFKCNIIWIIRNTDDISWFKNILAIVSKTVPVNILDIKIFLTEKIEEERNFMKKMGSLEKPNIIEDEIGIEIYHGRPVIKNIIFDYINTLGRSKVKINIFCCSIKAVKKETKIVCQALTSKNYNLNFIEEVFL